MILITLQAHFINIPSLILLGTRLHRFAERVALCLNDVSVSRVDWILVFLRSDRWLSLIRLLQLLSFRGRSPISLSQACSSRCRDSPTRSEFCNHYASERTLPGSMCLFSLIRIWLGWAQKTDPFLITS